MVVLNDYFILKLQYINLLKLIGCFYSVHSGVSNGHQTTTTDTENI